jgi:nitroreductase
MKKNDFWELICSRRSIRFFENKDIPNDILDQIIEAGLRAPSSKNSQPWHIVVLKGKDKDKVCDWTTENPNNEAFGPGKMKDSQTSTSPLLSTNASLGVIKKAPVLLIIFNRGPFSGGREEVSRGNYGTIVKILNESIGIGACMENILLAADSFGLGGVAMFDIFPAESLMKKNFQIDYDFAIAIALGYPAFKPGKRPLEKEKFVKYI